MRLSLSLPELLAYVAGQLNAFYPDRLVRGADLAPHVETTLQRLEYCFTRIRLKYFYDGSGAVFSHRNTDQYAMFLYLLGNTVHRQEGDLSLAEKIYALNKALHSLDVFYEVQLPDIFAFQHPVGTVLGRGRYSDYFFVYQRCSVGANLGGVYPRFEQGVVMFGGSAVIGDCLIGGNSWLSVGTTLLDTDVPPDSVVFGRSPQHTVKPTGRDVRRDLFSGGRAAFQEVARLDTSVHLQGR